jgi:hypothetical protein
MGNHEGWETVKLTESGGFALVHVDLLHEVVDHAALISGDVS